MALNRRDTMDTAAPLVREPFDDSIDTALIVDEDDIKRPNPARRFQANVENFPVSSVILAALFGAGMVALTLMVGRAVRGKSINY